MRVSEFQRKVYAIEGFRIVFDAESNVEVGNYSFENRAPKDWNIGKWIDRRLNDIDDDIGFIVLDGDGNGAHGNMNLENLRDTYS